MSVEDFCYPFLSSYLASPQWFKSSVGQAYSLVAPLMRGRSHGMFAAQAALREEQEIRRLAQCKLATILKWAIETVPAYSGYRHLLNGLQQPELVLRQLPLVSREDVRRELSHFVSRAMPAGRRLKTFTGGSTSTPMMFYLHKGITRTKEYAFTENFHSRAGLSKSDVVLALRGRSVATARRPGGQLWMYEPIKREVIFSSDHLEHRYMPEYLKAIRLWKPAYIEAYPSAIYPLARWLRENPAPDVTQQIKGIMLFSENVLDHHLSLLREVFPCPILRHYGQSERVLMAGSMPDDERYFFWPQYGYFELVDAAGNPVTQPGMLGEIVGTAFDNQVMPFIRYRTGDMAILGDQPHPLLPAYPVVESIEGRLQEFIVCRDHRLISITSLSAGHSSVFAQAGIDSLQFEQWRPGHFVVKVVTAQPLSPQMRQRIIHAIQSKVQDGCTAEVVEVSSIARTARGKHKMLIQHLDLRAYLPAPGEGAWH